jgi:hypothetical protein
MLLLIVSELKVKKPKLTYSYTLGEHYQDVTMSTDAVAHFLAACWAQIPQLTYDRIPKLVDMVVRLT